MALLMLLFALNTFAAERFTYFSVTGDSVKLTWQKNTEPDIAEYRIYLNYVVWRAMRDTVYVTNVPLVRYYEKAAFFVTAKDSMGFESTPSDTVSAIFCQERGLFCDVDRDGKVNIIDKALFYNSLGSIAGDWQYSERKDFDGNATINIIDRALQNKNMGAQQWN